MVIPSLSLEGEESKEQGCLLQRRTYLKCYGNGEP